MCRVRRHIDLGRKPDALVAHVRFDKRGGGEGAQATAPHPDSTDFDPYVIALAHQGLPSIQGIENRTAQCRLFRQLSQRLVKPRVQLFQQTTRCRCSLAAKQNGLAPDACRTGINHRRPTTAI